VPVVPGHVLREPPAGTIHVLSSPGFFVLRTADFAPRQDKAFVFGKTVYAAIMRPSCTPDALHDAWLACVNITLFFAAVAFSTSRLGADGWQELYNPFRVQTIYLQMESSGWGAVVSDTDFDDPQNAQLWADGESPVAVTVKRKSDPAVGQKVSVKIDINARVPGQTWRGVKKLSLENGAEGGLVKEGFAWAMHRSASEGGFYNYPAAYAGWVRLVVDGQLIGVYVNVEERDKQMLENRGMWKEGATWLYKNDPNPSIEAGTGHSPTYQHLCYSPFGGACPAPSLEADLIGWIDMSGMLTLGAIEAFTGNHDGLFTHDGKNHFFADFAPPTELKRLYFPWDLDTGISEATKPILGYAGDYSAQILGHPWFRQWFLHILGDLIDGPLSEAVLTDFLNRVEPVLTPALLEDPNSSLEGNPGEHFETLRQWVTNRLANVRLQMGPVVGPPRFSPPRGEIVSGVQITLDHTNGSGTIYYTLDGTDPRALGGAVAGTAYAAPLTLTDTAHLAARVLAGTNWSSLRRATFNVAAHAAGLRVTELMFNPGATTAAFDNAEYEFLELQNRSSATLDLSQCEFDGIGFRFAPGTRVGPGEFVLLVRNALAFTNRYPGVPYDGIYWGALDNDGEKIRLRNSDGNNILSVEYDHTPPWPLGAGGFGWSLVSMNSGDPDDATQWRASANPHGSPGAVDPSPLHPPGILINEVLAHTDSPQEDAVELLNTSPAPVDLSGWWLSDALGSAEAAGTSLKKFRIPAGTVLEPGEYRVFYESQFNAETLGTNAFSLSSLGDQIYLASATSEGTLTGFITGAEFGASENGVSFGRIETSRGWDFASLNVVTFGVSNPTTLDQFRQGTGAANSSPRIGPVVINEVVYHPGAGGAEFIEFFNHTSGDIDLSGWRVDGAAFTFPAGTIIGANNFLVLVGATNISEGAFRSAHNVPPAVPVLVRPFDLKNEGEAVALLKPNDPATNAPIRVDRVRYNDKGPWPTEADGAGPSLERVSFVAYGNDPASWRTSLSGPTPGRENAPGPWVGIARGSRWKFHAEGRNLGAAWQTDLYSDSGWPTGRAPLGHGQPLMATVLSNPPPVTTYFRKEFVVGADPASITNLTMAANYDDGFVAYLNGQEIVRRSMPGGAVNAFLLADGHDGGVYETIDLIAARNQLRRGANVLAVELHQQTAHDADLVWDAELTYAMPTSGGGMPIRIISFEMVPPNFSLGWSSIPGEAYRVQTSADLITWTNVGEVIIASGTSAQFQAPSEVSSGPRFYRVTLAQ
jgi:hypothetical protein